MTIESISDARRSNMAGAPKRLGGEKGKFDESGYHAGFWCNERGIHYQALTQACEDVQTKFPLRMQKCSSDGNRIRFIWQPVRKQSKRRYREEKTDSSVNFERKG